MPADGEQSPVHEPGDDDGTTDEAEDVAGCAEEDELGDADDPARREGRRGGRPCTFTV